MLLQSMVKRCEGPKVAAHLLHRGRVAAQRLRPGAGDAADHGQELSQRMLDVDHMPTAIGPLAQIGGSLALFHAAAHSLGQQRVPILVAGRKPVGAGVHHDLFLGKVGLGPAIVLCVLAQLRLQNQRPSASRVCVTSEAAAESVVSRPSQLRIRSAALRRRSSVPAVWSMA